MEFWELVLEQDAKVDLAAATLEELRACACYPANMLFFLRPDQVGYASWAGYYQRRWRNLVLAFRSVVQRIHRRRTRGPGRMRPQWADAVLRLAARHLVPAVAPPGPAVLSRTNFGGAVLGVPAAVESMPLNWHARAERQLRWGRRAFPSPGSDRTTFDRLRAGLFAIDKFWLQVFGSMLGADVPPVCSVCRRPLGLTPQGKRSRATMCKPCADRKHYEERKQDPETLREQWREANARRRRVNKGRTRKGAK